MSLVFCCCCLLSLFFVVVLFLLFHSSFSKIFRTTAAQGEFIICQLAECAHRCIYFDTIRKVFVK